MRGMSGLLLIGIGVLHTIIGVFTGRGVLSRVVGATFFDEINRQLVMSLGRQFVFWFVFGGVLLIVLGHLVMWVERRLSRPAPAFVGWELVIVSAIGLVFFPVSGFWLLLAAGIHMIVTAGRAAVESP